MGQWPGGLGDRVLGIGVNHVLDDGVSRRPPGEILNRTTGLQPKPKDLLFRSKDPRSFIFKHIPLLLCRFEQH